MPKMKAMKAPRANKPEPDNEEPKPDESKANEAEPGEQRKLPGMEIGRNLWILKPVAGSDPMPGIMANYNEIQRRFNKLSRESAESGQLRKKSRELEDMTLVLRVLQELKAVVEHGNA